MSDTPEHQESAPEIVPSVGDKGAQLTAAKANLKRAREEVKAAKKRVIESKEVVKALKKTDGKADKAKTKLKKEK